MKLRRGAFNYMIIRVKRTKKLILLAAVLLFAAAQTLPAQNNPYEINDECYVHYVEAERLLGEEGFAAANEALLKTAIEKGDTKAQTLYYVEKLKNETRLRKGKPVTKADDGGHI